MRARPVIARLSAVVGMCVCLAGTTEPVAAHHAFAAEFDAERQVEFSGTVTRVEWINPHVWIHLDVTTEEGTVEGWAFEAGTPNVLFRRGFTRRSLLPGTDVLVDGYQAKDGTGRTAETSRLPMGPSYSLGRLALAPHTSLRDPVWTPRIRLGDRSVSFGENRLLASPSSYLLRCCRHLIESRRCRSVRATHPYVALRRHR